MAKNDAASATREAIKKAKRRTAADYTEPKAKPPKKHAAPVAEAEPVEDAEPTVTSVPTYKARSTVIRFIPPKGEYRVKWPLGVIRLFASPDGRVKARSRRGWTEQTPKQAAAIAARDTEAKRKAGREQARADAAARHEAWLKSGAAAFADPSARLDWLSGHTTASRATAIMDALASEELANV
jgi:hypothetical protein